MAEYTEMTNEELIKELRKRDRIAEEELSKGDPDAIKRRRVLIEMLHEQREALSDLKAVHDAQMDSEIASQKANLENAKEEQKYLKKTGQLTEEKYQANLRDLELNYKQIEASIKLKKANRDQFNTILTGITGISDAWKKTTWGMLLEPEGWAALSMGLKETFTPMNILGSSLMKVQEATMALAYAQDEAIAQMNKLTGAAPGLESQMIALEHEFSGVGVTADEAGHALSTLFNTVTDYNRMGPATQKQVADTTAVLNEMGVSAEVTARNIQSLTKVFGMSGIQAAETSRELFTFAQNIGMAPEEVASNFATAMPKMAAFGEQGVDTFKRLQAAAKQSGMAVDQMLSIVEKFDTFDGAAESVGRLNAILGGPFLSSLDMVTTTDPTERMRMLSQAVNQSGKSFDEMSYYQRKALADAMGLSDVSELALLMRDGFDAAVPAQQQSQEELAAQAEAAREFQTIKEELIQTVRQFAVSMRPVIKVFKGFLQLIQDVNAYFDGYFIPGVILVTGAFVTLKKTLFLVGAAGDAYRASVAALTTVKNFLTSGIFKNTAALVSNTAAKIKDAWATGVQTTAQTAQNQVIDEGTQGMQRQQRQMSQSGRAAGASAGQLIAFGFALLLIGGGVFLAALGIAAIALAFSQLDIAQMIGATVAIVAFGIGVIAVISALSALVAGPQAALVAGAAGVLLAVGAAALMAGAGVALIAVGMGYLVKSFAELLKTATPEKMLGFSIAFSGFVATLFLMVPLLNFLPLIALGLVAVGFAMWGMNKFINSLDLTNIEILGTFFGSLSSLMQQTQQDMDGVSEGIKKIVAEVNKLDTEKAIQLSTTMDSVTAITKVVATGNAGTSPAAATAQSGQPVTIVLKLKERVLAKQTGKIVNGMFSTDTDLSFAT